MPNESAFRSRILLLVKQEENYRLLAGLLRERYEILTAGQVADTFDLCILDPGGLEAHGSDLARRRRTSPDPLPAPVLLISSRVELARLSGRWRDAWTDILFTPILEAEVEIRIRSLLRAHSADRNLRRKIHAVEEEAGSIAHEFNDLLTVISGYSEMLANALEGSPRWRYAQEIVSAAASACEAARRLPVLCTRRVLEPRPLDLNSILDATAAMLDDAVQERIEIRMLKGDSLPLALADPVQVEQVLLDRVLQAREELPMGSVLTIQTESETGGDGRIVLSIEASVARARRFEMRFACLPRKGPQNPSGRHPDATVASTATVLLVEDSEHVRALIHEVLVDGGYRVFEARNATEALLLCRDLHERGHLLDLLLTDVVMPGTSGPELANQLIEFYPGMRVLYMSGYTFHAALPSNMEFLQKPFRPEVLSEKIRQMLGGSNKRRILIVDDDDAIRGLLRTVFERAGYYTAEATNGKKAVLELNRQPYDLVITDLIMPEQEGIETIKAVRRNYPGVKVVAMSGAFGEEYLKVARMVGAHEALQKPLRIEHVLETIRRALGTSGLSDHPCDRAAGGGV